MSRECPPAAARRSRWLAIVAGLIPLAAGSQVPGCGSAAPPAGSYTMVYQGVTRTYRLSIPPTYDPRRPTRLVLVFHGWGGDEGEFLNDATVVDESNRRGYLLAAPRGLGSGAPDHGNNSWTFRGSATGVVGEGSEKAPICDASITPDYTYASCRHGTAKNTCSWTQCEDDDVAFVKRLIAHLETTLCIDTHHVFAAGGSNGGMFTWELGQNPNTAPMLRAIAPIIGLPHRGDLRPPGKSGGLPVLVVTGRLDTTVPPGNWNDESYTTTSNDRDRFYYTGATAIVKRWAQADRCSTAHPEHPFNTGHPSFDCRSYCDAAGRAWPRVLDCRASMGHDYDLAESWKLVLDFFDRF